MSRSLRPSLVRSTNPAIAKWICCPGAQAGVSTRSPGTMMFDTLSSRIRQAATCSPTICDDFNASLGLRLHDGRRALVKHAERLLQVEVVGRADVDVHDALFLIDRGDRPRRASQTIASWNSSSGASGRRWSWPCPRSSCSPPSAAPSIWAVSSTIRVSFSVIWPAIPSICLRTSARSVWNFARSASKSLRA